MIHAFDTGPLIALLDNEPGAAVSAQLLAGNPGDCFVHAVNLSELYYICYRRGGVAAAAKALADLQSVGLLVATTWTNPFGRRPLRIKVVTQWPCRTATVSRWRGGWAQRLSPLTAPNLARWFR